MQAIHDFRYRWKNYKDNSRIYQSSGTFTHFSSPCLNGFLNGVSITFTNKTDPSDPLIQENYWRGTLRTMAPFGLNIEDSVRSVIMVINDSATTNI